MKLESWELPWWIRDPAAGGLWWWFWSSLSMLQGRQHGWGKVGHIWGMWGCQGTTAGVAWWGLQTPESQLTRENASSTLVCICPLLIPEQHHIQCPPGVTTMIENTKKQTNQQFRSPELLSFLRVEFFWNQLFLGPPNLVSNGPGTRCWVKVSYCPSLVPSFSLLLYMRKMHIPFHINPGICEWLCVTSYT